MFKSNSHSAVWNARNTFGLDMVKGAEAACAQCVCVYGARIPDFNVARSEAEKSFNKFSKSS